MSPSKFIDYEVVLLLAKYGRQQVLNALASRLDLSPTDLESILRTPPQSRPRSKRVDPVPEVIISQIIAKYPGKAELLKTLGARFERRSFLPELRDVTRFFREHGRGPKTFKSRKVSFQPLMALLAELDNAELDALSKAPEGRFSALGLISDEILRRRD